MAKEHTCPNCNSENVAELIYGLVVPDDELQRDLETGRAKLAGCEYAKSSPDLYCNDCKHQWKYGNRKATKIDLDSDWLEEALDS